MSEKISCSVRIDQELYDRLVHTAARHHITVEQFIAAALKAPIWLQLVLFLITALALLIFTRPVAVKYFNKDRVKTNVSSIIGKQAIVTAEIDNLQAAGKVIVSGQEWSARSCEEGITIPEGAVVVVEAVSGVKLMVRVKELQQ